MLCPPSPPLKYTGKISLVFVGDKNDLKEIIPIVENTIFMDVFYAISLFFKILKVTWVLRFMLYMF